MENSKKLKVGLIAVCASAIIGIGGVAAVQNNQLISIGNANTDKISIEISDETGQDHDLMPAKTLPHHIYITNTGNDCWLRINTVYSCPGLDNITKTDYKFDNNDNSDWVIGQDGYAYKKTILKAGQTIVIDEQVYNPFEEKAEGKQINNAFNAEGLQTHNVTPDFDSNTPWGSYVGSSQSLRSE